MSATVNINDLTIRQARELFSMFSLVAGAEIATLAGGTTAKPTPTDHGCALVIADRGHVWIGQSVITDDEWCSIKAARAVRRWGTTKGVNELVNGPLPDTKLDAPADLRVSKRAVIAVIPCEASKWTA